MIRNPKKRPYESGGIAGQRQELWHLRVSSTCKEGVYSCHPGSEPTGTMSAIENGVVLQSICGALGGDQCRAFSVHHGVSAGHACLFYMCLIQSEFDG